MFRNLLHVANLGNQHCNLHIFHFCPFRKVCIEKSTFYSEFSVKIVKKSKTFRRFHGFSDFWQQKDYSVATFQEDSNSTAEKKQDEIKMSKFDQIIPAWTVELLKHWYQLRFCFETLLTKNKKITVKLHGISSTISRTNYNRNSFNNSCYWSCTIARCSKIGSFNCFDARIFTSKTGNALNSHSSIILGKSNPKARELIS